MNFSDNLTHRSQKKHEATTTTTTKSTDQSEALKKKKKLKTVALCTKRRGIVDAPNQLNSPLL